jgi:hypothetical protein
MFLSLSSRIPMQCFDLGHDGLLSNPFHFIIHCISPYNSKLVTFLQNDPPTIHTVQSRSLCSMWTARLANIQETLLSNGFANKHVPTEKIELQQ